MAVESVDDIVIGDKIRFKTVSPHDNVYWRGTVISICTYEVARLFNGSNIDIYYQDVKRINPTMKDKATLTYIVLQVSQSESSSENVVFAKEWVDEGTLEKIDDTTYRDIRIHGIDSSKIGDIIKLIATTYPGYPVEEV